MKKFCKDCMFLRPAASNSKFSVPRALFFIFIILLALTGCSGKSKQVGQPPTDAPDSPDIASQAYKIGPGDVINIFVWGNPEVSVTVSVRPDGKVSSPLVEDMSAIGKTPTQLARDIEKILADYIKQPTVTVIVKQFGGLYNQQIRVVGEAGKPQGLPYREKMSLLDVMIAVEGLTEFAAGNKAKIVRTIHGKEEVIKVRLEDLLKDGDIKANREMMPGDILIIPESWF